MKTLRTQLPPPAPNIQGPSPKGQPMSMAMRVVFAILAVVALVGLARGYVESLEDGMAERRENASVFNFGHAEQDFDYDYDPAYDEEASAIIRQAGREISWNDMAISDRSSICHGLKTSSEDEVFEIYRGIGGDVGQRTAMAFFRRACP